MSNLVRRLTAALEICSAKDKFLDDGFYYQRGNSAWRYWYDRNVKTWYAYVVDKKGDEIDGSLQDSYTKAGLLKIVDGFVERNEIPG